MHYPRRDQGPHAGRARIVARDAGQPGRRRHAHGELRGIYDPGTQTCG